MNGALATAALTLLDTPFRLHGRDPRTGLDCVGLVAEAMRRAGFPPATIPEGYSMRVSQIQRFIPLAAATGLIPAADDPDIVLAMTNPVQPHLLIVAAEGFVHAHAGLGKVTYHPAPLSWPVAKGWRLPAERL
ncbi:MAG: hypothetical protein RIS94_551 [Pseudomonadota bacterium]|jgi:hypothetical protein